MITAMLRRLGLAALLGAAAAGPAAAAQPAYPTGPIRLVVPFATGGGTDVVSRVLAKELTSSLGKTVFVDNKPGANGTIGTMSALQAAPDGYTLLLAIEATVAINPGLYKYVKYRPGDFEAISLVSKQPYLIVANPALKAGSLSELVAQAKAEPGKLNYATGASAAFLAGELFKSTAGVDIGNVPYKGSGEAITDVLGGRVELMVASPVSVMPQIKSGKLKVLAVTSAHRYALLPDVPTVAEQGYPGFDAEGWYGLVAPKGTPAHIVATLNAKIAAAMQSPELQAQFQTAGVEPAQSGAAEFADYMQSESARWAGVIKQAGIEPQ
ncbi:hypothetical protein LMG26857_00597 [Achromobacter anxifer]|jgi:tripartite-type tricarboxylate transporter receptor subunit TctC|uniref:Bug family tripartite tricarboxylate transporter substrate binding protein n=1 Tax=Achromobacter anxifer TaxID=1287737 RepID=UPI00155C6C86|nr:tripartite tricarboxylate transporter substrate binding protein [Achromobacter anxifer]CAB5511310.1 hypothetical protein LMG26857_00597 [Achromobacter anxifer]